MFASEYTVPYIYIHIWPPLWSSGQSSWLQIQTSGFDSQRYQIFWKVVGLERGPLSLITVEKLLQRQSSGFGLESREYGCRDLWRWTCGTLYLQKLALTSSTRGGRSVGMVRSWIQATEFVFFVDIYIHNVAHLNTIKGQSIFWSVILFRTLDVWFVHFWIPNLISWAFKHFKQHVKRKVLLILLIKQGVSIDF
jgi:hypothetical protein